MSDHFDNLGLFVRAISFASLKHRNQRRKDANSSPYINHPIALVDVLVNEGGVGDIPILCAAILHDTIEDTETTAGELLAAFGEKIASIVVELTDDKTMEKQVRKELQVEHARFSSHEAKLVKLADKICNLRDILSAPPAHWGTERKREYFAWSARVVDGIRGVNPQMEMIFDGLLARVGEC